MDERKLKRLVVILLIAIALVVLLKSVLTRSYADLNKARAAQKQSSLQPAAESMPVAASTLADAIDPASAVTAVEVIAPGSSVSTSATDSVQGPAQ